MKRSTASAAMLGLPIAAAGLFTAVALLSPSAPGASAAPATPPEQEVEQGSEQAGVDEPVDGRRLFETQCSSCHGLDARGVDDRGPTLEPEGGASTDFVLRTGRMPLAAPGIQARRGPVRYDEAEIVALVEYVASIGSGPDVPEVDIAGADVSNGGELYRLNCAACHVSSGAGAPIGGGRSAPNLQLATSTEIAEAILVGPGSMPVFGEFDDDEIADVAAYIEVALQDAETTSASRFGGAGPVAEGLAAWILALLPLVALTRWIGQAKDGRDHPLEPDGDVDDDAQLDDLAHPIDDDEEEMAPS
ncbi:MAG: c-type cytochrome [Ilumatobacter sp.]|uniref:cytochrome bc1 complex diheme cytochrome c subunit n=1 Tax=Ilumatobacter sp. TaxID=1967498 RepID=UPI0032971BAE